MIPYFIFLFLVVGLAGLVEYFSSNKLVCRFLYVMIFLVMTLFAGLRSENVGTDSVRYSVLFSSTHTLQAVFDNFSTKELEIGFSLLACVGSTLSDNYAAFFLLCATLGSAFFCIGIRNSPTNCCIAFSAMIMGGFFTFGFNGMRQTIAIAICFCSMGTNSSKSFFRIVLFVALAILFHKSAIIFLPLYFICKLTRNDSLKNSLVILTIALAFVLLMPVLIEYSGVFYERYTLYGEDQRESVGTFSTLCLCFMGVFFFCIRNKISISKEHYVVLLHLLIFACAIAVGSLLCAQSGSGVRRLSLYFSVSVIFLWPIIYANISDRMYKLLFLVFFFSIGLVYYYLTTLNFNGLNPYIINPCVIP